MRRTIAGLTWQLWQLSPVLVLAFVSVPQAALRTVNTAALLPVTLAQRPAPACFASTGGVIVYTLCQRSAPPSATPLLVCRAL